jgi:tetraacyldisaccharide 4'-kinase
MSQIKKKIESLMNSRINPPVLSLASLLYGISILYGAGQKLRAAGYRHKILPSQKLPCKVVSVGNITVGGTGKTPMTIYVAEALKRIGYKVAIVSRGYGGGAERQGGIVSDGRTLYMESERAGDEPYMIACRLKGVPVVVGKNRFTAGMRAVSEFQPNVIVLDDAFQHLKLKRDIDLILLDYLHPFGNAHLLPRGILREPISSLARCSAAILTRCRTGGKAEGGHASMALIKKLLPARPLFKSYHVPYCYTVKSGIQTPFETISDFFAKDEISEIRNHEVFGFSGIARNDEFQNTVRDLKFSATGFLDFSDHHHYTAEDLAAIIGSARDTGAHRLITTEKDHVRLAHKSSFPMELIVVGVKISFEDGEQDFISFIQDHL